MHYSIFAYGLYLTVSLASYSAPFFFKNLQFTIPAHFADTGATFSKIKYVFYEERHFLLQGRVAY